MNFQKLQSNLFDWSISVTDIIPLGWINLDCHLSGPLEDFLEQDSLVISQALGLDEESRVSLDTAPSSLDRLDTLINLDVNGFLCVLQGRVFEVSGPNSWSSTCQVIERYVYAPTIDGLPKAISVAAKELKRETFPSQDTEEAA